MKIFSVEEANSLLPAVQQLVRKIQRAHNLIMSEKNEAKRAAEGAESGGGGISNGLAYATNLIRLSNLVSELETLGVQLKDFSRGLIDFPSLRDGRVVLLCWQLGEGDRLEWWHDVDAGFAGRTPL
ncbi:MAG TPA: DUF2203 domain-containing protein [Pyrinomonadaceae bacterium]|jgi:hypothetical protein|nr:DUF2203 domain-containing protein [Pyrinomonadaceae bacterium]